jgi:hypothetical protein
VKIIGCDLHAGQQTLAMLDTATGEVVKATLKHEGNHVPEFCSATGACGDRSHRIHAVVCESPEELGIECLGGIRQRLERPEPRKQKHDRRDADLLLSLLVEERFPAIWLLTKELLYSGLIAAPTPVGVPAGQNTKCAAGDRLREWSSTRAFAVDASRPIRDRVFAVVAACRSSAESVAGDVCEIRDGDRKTKLASRAASS